jgi:hypothetical protein
MLQHDANFHDDVKLVLVYSLITRLMLRNVQRSPIGKRNFPTLMSKAYSTYAVLEDREKFLCTVLPELHEFVQQHLCLTNDQEKEFIDSIAEVSFYIIAHADDQNMHSTIALCTNPTYRKSELQLAWNAGQKGGDFETWYKLQK